jgi:hypothetical protein
MSRTQGMNHSPGGRLARIRPLALGSVSLADLPHAQDRLALAPKFAFAVGGQRLGLRDAPLIQLGRFALRQLRGGRVGLPAQHIGHGGPGLPRVLDTRDRPARGARKLCAEAWGAHTRERNHHQGLFHTSKRHHPGRAAPDANLLLGSHALAPAESERGFGRSGLGLQRGDQHGSFQPERHHVARGARLAGGRKHLGLIQVAHATAFGGRCPR